MGIEACGDGVDTTSAYVPWKKVFDDPFGQKTVGVERLATVVGVMAVVATAVIPLVGGRLVVALGVFGFGIVALVYGMTWWSYVLVGRRSSNSCDIQRGRVIVKPRMLASSMVWATVFLLCAGPVTLFVALVGPFGTEWTRGSDPRRATAIVSASAMIALGLMFMATRPWRRRIELGPVGVEVGFGSRIPLEVTWDDVHRLRVEADELRVELHVNACPRISRNWYGAVAHGMTTIPLRELSVEPNALLRVLTELVENPESRAILESDRVAEFVCLGPPWREVEKLGMGTEISAAELGWR